MSPASVQEKPSTFFRGGRSDMYPNVNLNGFTLVSDEPPPPHQPVILGYRADHIPEVWFGIGYRCPSNNKGVPDQYWLGPRGRDPHYDALGTDDVILWRSFEKPFCFEDDTPGSSSYLQWRYILGDVKEDADFAADEANAAYWAAQPAASAELPWESWNGNVSRAIVYIGDRRGHIVATEHPAGFGVNGETMPCRHSYGQPLLILDPKAIPDSLWRDGGVSPQRTVRGYHASRFAIGEFDGWGMQQATTRDYESLICYHSGTTSDSPLHWSPAGGRGRGGHGLRRWVSFLDLWNSLPETIRNEHRYQWQGMRRGYERINVPRNEQK